MTDREEEEALTEDSENVVEEDVGQMARGEEEALTEGSTNVVEEDVGQMDRGQEEALTEESENVVEEDVGQIGRDQEEALTEVSKNVVEEDVGHMEREEEKALTEDSENPVEQNVGQMDREEEAWTEESENLVEEDIGYMDREEEATLTEESENWVEEDVGQMDREEEEALTENSENVVEEDVKSKVSDEDNQHISGGKGEEAFQSLTNRYCGNWDVFGLNKEELYGVVYDGEFDDGQYHGDGTLTYPMGHKFYGTWCHGRLINYRFQFPDSLEYVTDWKYCKMPDRRYFACIQDGLRPAGRSLLTNDEPPPRRIPEGCYDTGDGFYNPKTKCVMSAIRPGHIIRIPKKSEEAWIMPHCRKAWDQPTEYNPKLYEKWVSGRKGECEKR
ncbi:cilia- and flagella-associated protein 251-like [Photinus pyralis]|uniref:cilia- and flagella-associated protein 251-like n=1 Tax=Photinus pyralis TaxID=7054 RepID=UPI0012673D40|nr:cilia- and flagella-associated protein 251-like [Photinus pyralis]